MTDREFQRLVRYSHDQYGIDLSAKRVIVEGRLNNYISNRGYNSYTEYFDYVNADPTKKEAQNLINILTTNHTFFMREFDHMNYFKSTILPWIKEKEKQSRDMRIWCAACSSGEEPYTLAMIIKDFLGLDYATWDTMILATDVSSKVLSKAIAGRYPSSALESVPDVWKRQHFKACGGDEYQVTDQLKEHVLFRQFNLMHNLPFKHKMHTVFLRNVMIYFDENTKNALVEKIYDAMEPGGFLIIGSTESIQKTHTRFKYVRPSIFRKGDD
ncbi:chemotaxis protein methyltransferase CheR [Acetitomaculum ruminis DSM 5522]|uniref:protein-glutamate O-methyltransferase n=1 Tax=Acetitomaculum ruminis DSM 5522 TaxID=1120918 RepID=A0A1I0WEB2_9FIRM|nr:protein-glutamate O-methyltransferase CheR [Acetitomaculum ruminis]SFA86578.1 chemotaxis protein methyltransferase CheR [Acetitomaculum ruminis DSM 5522]